MRVPFGHINISKKTRQKINKILKNNQISQGKYVNKLEEKFAKFIGTKYAVAVSSGTNALILSLATLPKDDRKEVIVPALTFPATWAAVVHAGYKPVPVDIDKFTLNMNYAGITKKINENTKAILPVHLMGKPFPINNFNFDKNINIIEDGCEAHGSKIKSLSSGVFNNVGTLGDMAAFSLYVSHILYSGEGGIVTTDSSEYFTKMRRLRNHGRVYDVPNYDSYNSTDNGIDKRFLFNEIGYNFKMNEVEALLGLGSLQKAKENISKRRTNFLYYSNQFKNFRDYFLPYENTPNEYISPHALPIVLKTDKFTRNEFMKYLQLKCGIDCRTLFQSISSIKPYGIKENFPEAEYVEKNGLHIGVHSGINKEKREYVIDCIKNFLERKG